MDVLQDEKSSFVLGLLITVLGWHITQLTQEIRATHSVAYWVEQSSDGRNLEITLQNVSTSKSVQQLPVQITCPDGELCMADGDIEFRSYPPTLTPSLPMITKVQSTHLLQITLAAGGKLGILVRCHKGLACPDFYIKPADDLPLNIFVLDGSSIRGFFVVRYFEITVVSLLLVALALLGVVVTSLRARLWGAKRSSGHATRKRALFRAGGHAR